MILFFGHFVYIKRDKVGLNNNSLGDRTPPIDFCSICYIFTCRKEKTDYSHVGYLIFDDLRDHRFYLSTGIDSTDTINLDLLK